MKMQLIPSCIFASWMLAMTLAEEVIPPKVFSISPREASTEGGTRLYVYGEGFSASQNLNSDPSQSNLGNKVYLVSDKETVPCIVENDASHEKIITCYTEPMKGNVHYYVKVEVDGKEIPFEENCNNNPRNWRCRFIPRWYYTPHIRSCHTEVGVNREYPESNSYAPGNLVKCQGRIYTQIFGSNNQTNPNERKTSFRRIYLGGHTCQLLKGPDVFYNLTLTNGDEGVFTCKPISTFIGHENVSFILSENFGRSSIDNALMHVSGKDVVYNFQTYAEITGITPQSGSAMGGTRLKITGNNFDDTTEPIRVNVGGMECDVVEGTLTSSSVECVTRATGEKKEYYPGSRGVIREEWNGTVAYPDDVLELFTNASDYQGPVWMDQAGYRWDNAQDSFNAKYTGIFVAPKTDLYKFKFRSDDHGALYINCNGSRQNLNKLVYTDRARSDFSDASQVSDWISLTKGQQCYFLSAVREWGGAAHMYVAVHRATTTLTNSQANDARNERQLVNFAAPYTREKQTLNFTDLTPGTGVSEVQQVIVTHSCISSGNCETVGYRLIYGGVKTLFIRADAPSSTVKNALNNIYALSDENIMVTETDGSGRKTYSVEFRKERGNHPLLGYEVYPANVQGLSIAITETTAGVSERKDFKLVFAGRHTAAIAYGATQEQMESALKDTRSTYCPPFLLPDIRKSTVITTRDYETSYQSVWGWRVTTVEPFCGRTSLLNPSYVYYAGRTGDTSDHVHPEFDASVNKWFCFGHRGLMHEYFWLTGTFRGGDKVITGTHHFLLPVDTHETEWRYSCLDLMEIVLSRSDFSFVQEVTIRIIRMSTLDRDHNFWLDAITIGSSKTTDDIDGVVGVRTRPALATGETIKDVWVTKKENESFYTVEVDTYNCGYEIPLLSMAYTSVSSSTINGQTQRETYWPASTSIVTERLVSGVQAMMGHFDLNITGEDGNDYIVKNISVNIPTKGFEELLEALVPGFGQAKVTLRGSCHARDYEIEWLTNGGDKPLMRVHFENVVGHPDITASVITLEDGGILHNPMTGDMLRIAFDNPQVEVFANGLPSKCLGDCKFLQTEALTPVVTDISPRSGSVAENTVMTINGNRLDAIGNYSSTVLIGSAACNITSHTATQIQCNLDEGQLGTYNVLVEVGGKGFARKEFDNTSLSFTIRGAANSILPISGFKTGGTIVTISGYGFTKNTTFSFDGNLCKVISVTSLQATCTTPAYTGSSTSVNVVVQDGSEILGTLTFTYIMTGVANVTMINPASSTVNGGGNLTITGINLGSSSDVVKVSLGDFPCEILAWAATSIICKLPSAPPASHKLYVVIKGMGYADTSTNNIPDISYFLEVTDVTPTVGSTNGGTAMIISGNGFTDEDVIQIKFGQSPCIISKMTSSSVECVTTRFTKNYMITNGGRHPSEGIGFAWSPLTLRVRIGDSVTWKWEFDVAKGSVYGAIVFTTASPTDDEYDGVGFRSSTVKSQKGSFTYYFTEKGMFYVSSGKVDNERWGTNVMRCAIEVVAEESMANALSLQLSGHEAIYTKSVSRKRRNSGSCSGEVSVVPGCTTPSVSIDPAKFVFVSDKCYTPTVTSISPLNGTSDDTITIKGSGFGMENCANKVTIAKGYSGEYECALVSSSSGTITCRPDSVALTNINTAYYVTVTVNNIGTASTRIKADSERRFVLLPDIKSVSPSSGSLAGQHLITITGAGLSSATSVTVGGYSCMIQSISAFEITCLTPSSQSAGIQNVEVLMNGYSIKCTGTCQYDYSDNLTPKITSVDPGIINQPDINVTFVGSNFGSNASAVQVYMGEHSCTVNSVTAQKIVCTISDLPAGYHGIKITIDSRGKANIVSGTRTHMTSQAIITSMTPVNGSNAGGTVITFIGNGFMSDDLSVSLSSRSCDVKKDSVTNFQFQCVTPEKWGGSIKSVVVSSNGQTYSTLEFRYSSQLTPALTSISPTQGDSGDNVTINGTLLDPDNMMVWVGAAECTDITGSEDMITCTLGNHPGGYYQVSATVGMLGVAQSTLTFNYNFAVSSASPSSGSFAGGDLVTLSGKGFGSDSKILICDSDCMHGDDYAGTSAGWNEIVCLLSAANTTSYDSDKVCNVTVSIDGQTATGENLYTFAADKTPIVTGVSPTRGGTQGGTQITISGSGFSSAGSASVKVGGITCDVNTSSNTEIVCTTNSRGKSVKDLIEVVIPGKGNAVNNEVEFYYVDVWSSRYTWGGQDPPIAGDFIVVPTGQTLLLDVDTPILKMLLINGGAVLFDEKDIHLQAENVLITEGGLLQVGTEETPFEYNATITLYGNLRSPELPIYGAKAIGVRNGTLDLHGKPVSVTWTHLSETATKGSKILKLTQSVSWKAGDEIVIATTGDRHSQRETETATIESVSGDGQTLTLVDPVEWEHISVTNIFDGVTVHTRAEIGLLTRNIVVQGSKHTDWSKDVIPACEGGFNTGEFVSQTCFQGRSGEEEGSAENGGVIMIHHPAPNLRIANARIEFVELRHMGQAFRLGRYPIHFHLLGDVANKSYVRGCAIHNTFNRAVTIHNTHNLLVEHNVVHNVKGGAMFIEDGIEHGNVLQYNLVVFCRQSTSLQNEDITPAAFWVTNPNNTIRHNTATGGTHFGFWYRIHEHPDGPSFDINSCPRHIPLKEFSNNTVHSQGWFGLWIFQQYFPKKGGACAATEPEPALFDSLTVWNCEKGIEFVNVGAVKVKNSVLLSNDNAGVETKQIVDKNVRWGDVGLYNTMIIAYAPGLPTGPTSRGVILPFSEGFETFNVTFVNFNATGISTIGVTSIDGTCTVLCGGWESRFANIKFINSPNKATFRWEHEVILRDMDGTLTGTNKQHVVTPKNPTVSPDECTESPDFSLGDLPGVVCDGTKKFIRVSWNNVSPTSLEAKSVTFTNKHGSSRISFAKKRLTHKFGWMGTMENYDTVQWAFQEAEHITNISYSAVFYGLQKNDCIIVSHNLTQKPDKILIADNSEEAAKTEMVNCAINVHGDHFYDTNSKVLFYIVSGKDRGSRKRRFATEGDVDRPVNFRVFRCFYKDCIPPPDPNLTPPARERPTEFVSWHSTARWTSVNGQFVGSMAGVTNATIPTDNSNVKIAKGSWMVIDQDFPKINELWIEGVLELEGNNPSLSFTLSATHIVILGGRLIIGWEDNSFKGLVNIILRGDINTEEKVVEGGVVVGAKAIGVLGGLDIHGFHREVIRTHLAKPLEVGQNQIGVTESTKWVVDDDIVIATTSSDPWETETFKVTAVNGTTITLNDTAKYEHLADSYTYTDGEGNTQTYDIRAEVSLLTRNIRIIGEDAGKLFDYSLGGRVLVAGAGAARGYARIENAEFYHTGQEGYIDNYDPRYSIAFLHTGPVDDIKPSYLKRNTFHNGFNTAIGVFHATRLNIDDNVIHHTIGPGIRAEGTLISLRRNLVMLARSRTVYQDRFELDLLLWKAAIEVNLAIDPYLEDNVVAGSERAGYRIDGYECGSESPGWGTNTAKATLHGIWMNQGDGYRTCTRMENFKIHGAYDNGVYYQSDGSLQISNFLVTDSNQAFMSSIFGPSSIGHGFQEKFFEIEKSTVIAVSKTDYCPDLDTSSAYVRSSSLARIKKRPSVSSTSRVAFFWPSFNSGHNAAPSKPFVGSISAPAIAGRLDMKEISLINFDDTSCGTHTVFMTNLKVEDFLHPIRTEKIRMTNTSKSRLIYYNRPSIGKINPSDCVDMECDGMKNALLIDKDGSTLGSPGTAIPESEYEWNGDKKRGLGDYRIPKTLLTGINGERLLPEDIFPSKGILRANTSEENCTYNNEWQGYECHGYKHGILVIESMDEDSETRRISPVALASNGYVDLFNGPQDHGWCFGYTCQERLSTFWTIVAFNKQYSMHMTGTMPQTLRLRMLNGVKTTRMVLAIYYTRPQRKDVYVNGNYLPPKNSIVNELGEEVLVAPSISNLDEYLPNIGNSSDIAGSNYYDRVRNTIHVLVDGRDRIDIIEANVVVLTFGVPATSIDDFFKNLVSNLATFLNIDPSKIRIVSAIREGSRRKRAAGDTMVAVEIGEPAAQNISDPGAVTPITSTSAPNATTGTTTISPNTIELQELNERVGKVVTAMQDNTLSNTLGFEINSLAVVDVRKPAVRNPNNTNNTDPVLEKVLNVVVPSKLRIITQPLSGYAGQIINPTIKVTAVDVSDNDITLGHEGDRWHATLSIQNGDQTSILGGQTINYFDDDGLAKFENLTISKAGSYVLKIIVTYPANQDNLFALTNPFTLTEAVTTKSTTVSVTSATSTSAVPIDPISNNLTIIIACSVVGGVILIIALVVFFLKGPFANNPHRTKVNPRGDANAYELYPSGKYSSVQPPPAYQKQESGYVSKAYVMDGEESNHPNAVVENDGPEKRPPPYA